MESYARDIEGGVGSGYGDSVSSCEGRFEVTTSRGEGEGFVLCVLNVARVVMEIVARS
jgi:hypothetical protein